MNEAEIAAVKAAEQRVLTAQRAYFRALAEWISESEARPCAHIDMHPSHGIVPCDLDRVPGTEYCENHQ